MIRLHVPKKKLPKIYSALYKDYKQHYIKIICDKNGPFINMFYQICNQCQMSKF